VDFRDRLSQKTRENISNVRLDRLPLRGPHIPAASELQSNNWTNVGTQAVHVRFQAERISEQEGLLIGVGPSERSFEARRRRCLNSLRTLACQFIQFPVALVCARDVGRVLLSDESEGMAVEDDVNIFRETLDDLVGLRQRGPAFEEGPWQCWI
jgi:hypothetical protein